MRDIFNTRSSVELEHVRLLEPTTRPATPSSSLPRRGQRNGGGDRHRGESHSESPVGVILSRPSSLLLLLLGGAGLSRHCQAELRSRILHSHGGDGSRRRSDGWGWKRVVGSWWVHRVSSRSSSFMLLLVQGETGSFSLLHLDIRFGLREIPTKWVWPRQNKKRSLSESLWSRKIQACFCVFVPSFDKVKEDSEIREWKRKVKSFMEEEETDQW